MIGVGQTLGRFQAKLGLDSTGYESGIGRGVAASKLFGSSFKQYVVNPLVVGAAALTAAAGTVAYLSAKQIEYAETLQRTAQITGASEQLLVALQKRLEVAGYGAEVGAQGINAFAQRLIDLQNGTGPLKDLSDQLGVVIDQAAPMDRVFGQVLDLLDALPAGAQRSAIAARIFGEEAGPKLINAIGGGSKAIQTMIDEARALGFRLDRTANDSLAGMNTQLGYFKLAVEGIKFNALNSFLKGLAGNSGGSVDGILSITSSINDQLAPSIEQLGAEVRPLLTEVAKLLPEAAAGVTLLAEGLNAIFDLLRDSGALQAWKEAIALPQAIATSLFETSYESQVQAATDRAYRQAGRSRGSTPSRLTYIEHELYD